jgi:hypothetical protein
MYTVLMKISSTYVLTTLLIFILAVPFFFHWKPSYVGMYPKDAVYLAQLDSSVFDQFKLDCVKTIMAGASVFPSSINQELKKRFSGLTGPIRQVF